MGDVNHGHIQWTYLEITRGEDQHLLFFNQDSFLTQNVLEPTRVDKVLYLVYSSQIELVENVKIHEPLDNFDHN